MSKVIASGASYGVFKLSTLAFSLGSSVLLMIEDPCIDLIKIK